MNTKPQCTCQAAPRLIFPCSGASDVGGLSDRGARQMTLDLGLEKGATRVTAARIRQVADRGAESLVS